MADPTAKIEKFSNGVQLKEQRKTVKAGETTLFEGQLAVVLTAAPLVVQKAADIAGVAYATVVKRTTDEGNECLLAHPLSGDEYGPYPYTPGSADDSLIGTEVFVVDSGSVSNSGGSNNVRVGNISRIEDANSVYVRLMSKKQ